MALASARRARCEINAPCSKAITNRSSRRVQSHVPMRSCSRLNRRVRALKEMHRHILVVTFGLTLLGGCGAVCENEISQTIASPSGRMKAVVFNRVCDATVGFNTQVSLIPATARLPNDGGNVLVVDDTVRLKVEWESDVAVRITGRLDTQIFKQEASVSGVQVAYAN